MQNKEAPKKETNEKKRKGIFKHLDNIEDNIENKHIRTIATGAILVFGILIPTIVIGILIPTIVIVYLFNFLIGKIIIWAILAIFIFWMFGKWIESKSPPEEDNQYY